MKSEYKLQLAQYKADVIAESTAPLTASERCQLWPESQYGGDGPWNNYGDEEGAGAVYVPTPMEKLPFYAEIEGGHCHF